MTNADKKPPIRMRLDGFEDFWDVVNRLRATGARHESNRVFVVDHDLTAVQVAALLEFIGSYRHDFLHVEVNAPELEDAAEYEELEDFWFGRTE